MTKQNPRPRKYASDAERQAAYRSRAAEVCVRLEPKTMTTLDSIADEIGYSRNELMQSMVKFGLTNRDWRNEGLTAHKRLPRYQENPMATRTPTPAQLAARERFAEMARSGVLNRKRQIAAKKRKVNPSTMYIVFVETGGKWKQMRVTENKQIAIDLAEAFSVDGKHAVVEDSVGRLVYDNATKKNPRKKTVSQKISQLRHEGYPQKQAVAVALNEQRAGKVKRNPQVKSVKSASASNFPYCVEAKRSLGSAGSVFEMVAGFPTKTQAQNYVDAILTSHPGATLRIKTYK